MKYNCDMNKKHKFLSTFLLVVGIFALCLGCAGVIRRVYDTKKTIRSETDTSSSISSDIVFSTDAASDLETKSDPTDFSESLSEDTETETSLSSETDATTKEVVVSSETEVASESESAVSEAYISPYETYFTSYPDIAAWFQIPGTNIDYPVMWTPGDETYYLYKHYDGSDNINGSLLLDTDSSLSPLTTNLIIHGHNMKSGAMFGTLPMYKDESYYEQHKEMLLYTPNGERTYEIIAVFRSQVFKKSDTCFKYYKFFQADTEEEFNDFYNNIKALSLYDTGVTAEFGDHFITLSTCVSHVENGRFVVVAKEVPNELTPTD